MNLEYRNLLDKGFAPDSRVWIYQSSRLFTLHEALAIEELLNNFTTTWLTHGVLVKGAGYLFFGQFIILMADEQATGVSGCSTDSSVRLIKDIEQRFGVNMFDRTTLAFVVKGKVQLLPLSQLQYASDNGFIDSDTLYFNNLVQTKEELERNWIVPIKNSWLTKKISLNKSVS
ncbi:MAG TPA: hypothetical protein VFH08_05935 [Chitinophagaceae bacterium]|nr:hypothetical protein [Chitinophagaceae bacterium]